MKTFVSKHAANIDGLGEKGVSLFLEKGLVTDFASIYRLPERRDEILALEGFETKKSDNLLHEIERSRSMELSRLLVGLGIPEVGRKTAKTLAGYVAGKMSSIVPLAGVAEGGLQGNVAEVRASDSAGPSGRGLGASKDSSEFGNSTSAVPMPFGTATKSHQYPPSEKTV